MSRTRLQNGSYAHSILMELPGLSWISRRGFFALIAIATCLSTHAIADEVRLIDSERDALQTRLTMIESATESIDVAYYEIHDDTTSGQVLAALDLAAARGVCVRLLTDGHLGGNSMPKALMEHLIDCRVSIRERPVDVRYQVEIGRPRLHDKLLIIDRSMMLTGGRNLTENYYGIGCRKSIDRDVYATGSCAVCASEYFQSRWNESKVAQPTLDRRERARVVEKQTHPEWNILPRSEAKTSVTAWLACCAALPLAAADIFHRPKESLYLDVESSRVQFLHDCVGGSKQSIGGISSEILRRLEQARYSIDIESPYFVITHRLRTILTDAVRRGVRVRILTNSLETTDQVIAHAGYADQRRGLLRVGIDLYEFQGGSTLHAKSMIVDRTISMVGTYNFDILSERRNSEVALLIDDPVFAETLSQSLEALRSRAKSMQLSGLFRIDAKESDAPRDTLRKFQRSRFVAPIAKPFL